VSLKFMCGLALTAILALAMLLPQGTIAVRAEPALVHWKTLAIAPPTLPSAQADRLRQDLSKRTGKPPQVFRVTEATQKTWSNGCLDLARPDELCTESLVEGWRVVLSEGDRLWIYHTDRRGQTYRLNPSTANP